MSKTHKFLSGDGRENDTQQSHDQVGFAHESDVLRSRAILEGNEEVLSLTSNERVSLSSSDRRFGAERDEGPDDELESGEKELMVTLGSRRDEAVEI